MGGKAKEDPDSSQRRGKKERGTRKLCVSLLDLWIDRSVEEGNGGRTDVNRES